MKKKILLFPTMRCNLHCSYCHFKLAYVNEKSYSWKGYNTEHFIQEELPYTDFIDFIKKSAPCHIEFSGGEPTIYKEFKELIANIPNECTWAITSNCMGSGYEDYDLSKCISWTSSAHKVNDKYIDNIETLLRKRVPLSISVVVPFNDIDNALNKARAIRQTGCRVNLLRELNVNVDWENTKEWEKLAKMGNEGFLIVIDDIPPNFNFSSGYLCNAGFNYVSVMPNGKVYRCYSDAMNGEELGNIKTFNWFDSPKDCFRPCLGCAEDHKSRIKKL